MENLLHKKIYLNVKDVDEDKYIIRGIFSTPDVDRHDEIVDQKGWKLNEFMQNPVILWAHDQWQPAIGKMTELGYDANGNLAGAIQFAVEEYEFAKTIFNLMKGGFIRAFSVGFRNDVYEFNQETDQVTLLENTLYEVSVVNVPANAMALAASKGMDLSPLKKALAEAATKKEIREKKTDEVETKELESQIVTGIKKTLSNDTAKSKAKVETPAGKGANSQRIKAINNAIRSLLKEKQSLKIN